MAEFGTLSSLGIGSGVLNSNLIDKLKNADTQLMIDPLKNKLNLLQKRDTALSKFITIASTVKSDTIDLAQGTAFAKVSTNVMGSSVSVNANDGVKPQRFDIDVKNLAQNDVYESKGFSGTDSIINSSGADQKVKIGVGGTSSTITIKNNATLSDLKDDINNANVGITASIIDTGIGNNPYKLVLKANDTGKDNIIKFNYSNINDIGANATTYTSKKYDSDTDKVNDSGATQTFAVTVNGTKYSMDVDDGTTVKDFVDDINNGDLKDSDGNELGISASYNSNTGKIEFNLKEIGDISIDDTNLTTDFNDNTDFTNANRLQKAEDSDFTYNGVEINRSSNKIDDLITGVTINLNSTGSSSVDISSNVDDITKSIQQFVADYNAMISNLQNLTAFNKDSGNVGLFQGNSDFTMISSKLSSDLFDTTLNYTTTQSDLNGNSYQTQAIFSAADMGLSMNRTGMLSFDATTFQKTYAKHPDIVKQFSTNAFTKLDSDFDSIATGNNSDLELLDQNIKDQEKDYQKRIDSMNQFLDTKYNIMSEQFALYNDTINQFNVQSKSLNMTIQQAINSKG